MSLRKFSFKVISKENYARTGLIKTHRGKIHTPVFMPVGTQATVKATFIDDIIETGSEIILANTYHLICLLYTSPSPRDRQKSRMPSSA